MEEQNQSTVQQEFVLTKEAFIDAFNTSPIGMALVAPDGAWLKVNDAVCSIVGYAREELLKITFQDITHEEDLEKDLGKVQDMLAGKIKTYDMEKRYYHKDGHVVWVLLSVSLTHKEDGSPRFFVSQIMDITARKLAEKELDARIHELETVNNSMIGRESKMVELKHEVDELLQELGRQPKYNSPL